VVEAWADQRGGGAFWVGEESKRLLDAGGEAPMPARLSVPDDAVPVFYGPRLCDVESLPREESLRARVLSMQGIAVAWITLDRFGGRVSYEPASPADPVFHLRRPGGGAGHVWRRFTTKREAIDFMREAYGAESEGSEWAAMLPARRLRRSAEAVRGEGVSARSAGGADLLEHGQEVAAELCGVLAHREVADLLHHRHPRALDLGRRALGVGRRAREVVLAREQVQRTGPGVDLADTVSKVAVRAVEEEIALEHAGPPCMYIQRVSQRVSLGLCGAMSPDMSAPAISPPCTSGRWSQPVSSYHGA